MSTVCEHCGRPGAVHARPCCESPDGPIVGAEPGPEYVDQDRDTLSLTEENIERALSRMVATRTPQGLTDVKRKRVSRVYKISDYPAGTRRRGWGLLHDQIWFYDTPPNDDRIRPVTGDVSVDAGTGKLWRRDEEGRWLRLYMTRRMIWLPRWLGGLRLRVHRFHSGDDDSAPHDHPWSFWTFPLSTYYETVEITSEAEVRRGDQPIGYVGPTSEGNYYARVVREVRRFRLHRRPATYRHFVHEPSRPFTTIVIARETYPPRVWGFWAPPDGTFVPHTEWTEYDN